MVENKQDAAGREDNKVDSGNGGTLLGRKWKRVLCARPFATVKGHSAFLTFATAGNLKKEG